MPHLSGRPSLGGLGRHLTPPLNMCEKINFAHFGMHAFIGKHRMCQQRRNLLAVFPNLFPIFLWYLPIVIVQHSGIFVHFLWYRPIFIARYPAIKMKMYGICR